MFACFPQFKFSTQHNKDEARKKKTAKVVLKPHRLIQTGVEMKNSE
jgi:hypothetical protein